MASLIFRKRYPNIFFINKFLWFRCVSTAPRVVEVGKCEKPKTNESYKTGQTFLHLLFDYRGVILYPWLAKVHDMDTVVKGSNNSSKSEKKEVKSKEKIYYQVLIDDRDLEYSNKWLKAEQMTMVHEDGMVSDLNSKSGLDYVSHEDILPYTGVDSSPIEHKFLNQFLIYANKFSPHYEAQEHLFKHPWLKTYDVFRKTTENIRVTVIPAFVGKQSREYWWRYCIRLENLGTETVQLRQREWRIYPRAGAPMRVRGRGVVGEEPVLSPEFPFFQYSSQVSLQAACGYMGGIYTMEGKNQRQFEVKIPNFSLESKINFEPSNEV